MKKITKTGKLTNRPPSAALKTSKTDNCDCQSSLTPKELQFCSNYTALGEDTFGRKELSAKEAGYPTPRNAAYRLLQRPDIQQQIAVFTAEHLERNRVTVDGVIADICHDRTLARQRGDIGTAVRCDELLGKYLNLWKDVRIGIAFEPPEYNEMDIETRKEAARLAEARLLMDSWEKELKPVVTYNEDGKVVVESGHEQEFDTENAPDYAPSI